MFACCYGLLTFIYVVHDFVGLWALHSLPFVRTFIIILMILITYMTTTIFRRSVRYIRAGISCFIILHVCLWHTAQVCMWWYTLHMSATM